MLARIRPGSQNFGLGRSRGQNIDLGLRPDLKCLVSDSISGPQKSGLGLGIGLGGLGWCQCEVPANSVARPSRASLPTLARLVIRPYPRRCRD